jgi:hypothetical protein
MKLFVGAYWGPRQETREQCAVRVSIFLSRIAIKRPEFSAWHRLSRTKRKALESRIGFSPDDIRKHLETSKHFLDLGFSIALWNGRDDAGMSFRAQCGSYAERMKNAVVLYLPEHYDDPSMYDRDLLRSLLVDIVAAFDPDDAVVTSSEFAQQQGDEWFKRSKGWFEYHRGEDIRENPDFPIPK